MCEMPWKAVGKKIVKTDTGEVVGTSKDHATAVKAVRARYANSKEYGGKGKKRGKKK